MKNAALALAPLLGLLAVGCPSKSGDTSSTEKPTAATPPSGEPAPGGDPAPAAAGAPSPKPSDAGWNAAIAAANAGLDAAYATWAKTAPAGTPAKKDSPWITGRDGAASAGDSSIGWSISWGNPAPAGYSYDVTVYLEPTGEVKLTSATATFAVE